MSDWRSEPLGDGPADFAEEDYVLDRALVELDGFLGGLGCSVREERNPVTIEVGRSGSMAYLEIAGPRTGGGNARTLVKLSHEEIGNLIQALHQAWRDPRVE